MHKARYDRDSSSSAHPCELEQTLFLLVVNRGLAKCGAAVKGDRPITTNVARAWTRRNLASVQCAATHSGFDRETSVEHLDVSMSMQRACARRALSRSRRSLPLVVHRVARYWRWTVLKLMYKPTEGARLMARRDSSVR